MSYAHRNGVVHRDIKPANILVDYDGHVRVVDFGIAGYFKKLANANGQQTQSVIMGTPAYMSPEQADPEAEASYLSDIYSLGVLMHELFLGFRPDEKKSVTQHLAKALMDIIRQCLHTDLKQRPQSAEEVERRLLLLLQGKHLANPLWEKSASATSYPIITNYLMC
ncbi:serine/threonine-protein kinase [Oceanicoccus sp. KOV_DT_Chl]|uniref:serine/threonine-protein kinase n=1 Tax=Oceanicoccus sp. KOV_DT_Chl TaxID=1904639 RepID=UPI00135C08D2|nr:serine/threonine-protein kinase [Oceanicoccus sp. KOV_DT_Chl]